MQMEREIEEEVPKFRSQDKSDILNPVDLKKIRDQLCRPVAYDYK